MLVMAYSTFVSKVDSFIIKKYTGNIVYALIDLTTYLQNYLTITVCFIDKRRPSFELIPI